MPNRFLFGVAFDRPGSRREAFPFQNKQSASLERGWEADCPPQADANRTYAYEQKAVSLRRQRINTPSLVPARPDYVFVLGTPYGVLQISQIIRDKQTHVC